MRGRSSSGAAVSGNRERRRKAKSSSPLKERIGTTSSKLSSQSELITSPSAATLLDHEPNTALSAEYSNPNSRKFADSVKKKCWEKADKVRGRDPSRWRRDPLGNLIFRKLVGCAGCLCHDYDHILPYSKGGQSTLENCQVLQATVNRSKGNRTDISKSDLIQQSSYCRVSDRDMDMLELSAFGNVRRGQDTGGCRIQ